MEYSLLIPRDEEGPCEHPLLLEFEDLDEIKKFPLDEVEEEDVLKLKGNRNGNNKKDVNNSSTLNNTNNTSGSSSRRGSKLFGRSLSKSKSVSEEVSPYIEDHSGPITTSTNNTKGKKASSSPIEIKGSPGKHRDGSLNKGPSSGDNSTSTTNSNNRISFFKVLTRRNSTTNQGKHKKLQDHWLQAPEPIMDGVTFCVKFLGSTLIEKTGASDAAEATKTVIQMVKAGHKPARLALSVCTNGISISDPATGEIRLEISIYDIAHCSADANYPNVFSFIATNKNDLNECYCFATRKRKMAQHITLTIAQAFNLAFELWQNSSVESTHNKYPSDDVKVIIGSTDSAKSCSSNGSVGSSGDVMVHQSHKDHHQRNSNSSTQWVHFDQDDQEVDDLSHHINSINMVTLSPFRRNNEISQRPLTASKKSMADHESEDLLICLT